MAKGKVISMDKETKKVVLKVSKGEEEFTVGKGVFNEKKFKVGDTIEYIMKGKNFEFVKKIFEEEQMRTSQRKESFSNQKSNKSSNVFTYPYNFVSLGDSKNIKRKSIEENKGNLSGKIKCTLKNITPLFIGGIESSNTGHKEESPLEINGNYIIPSSSLKGEIRNIVEVITNSCIRNVEPERLEKREAAGSRENIFGLIKRLPNEKTEENGLIVEAVKVKINKEVINKKEPGVYPIKVNEYISQYVDKSGRKNYKKGENDPDAINDIDTFEKVTEKGTENAILWVSPNISGKRYEKILVKKDFVQKGSGRNFIFPFNEYKDLEYLLNQRKERDRDLSEKDKKIGIEKIQVNDPIIFEVNNGKAVNLAFSEIPRLRYKYSPYELIPKEFQPCNSLNELCFACRLFGTTGNSQEIKNSNEITACMGRIFITDAKILKSKAKIVDNFIPLKPLGEPHPSLARFYLTDDTYDKDGVEIRGRKFYWHHSEKIKAGEEYENYIEKLKFKKENYNSSLKFLKPNNIFQFEVEFKNLTDVELGVLIYSLELENGLLHKFGKAKAFGFGSSKIEIKELLLKSKDRYINFITSYENKDCKKYKDIAMKEYVLDSKKEIKELKTILSEKNSLDFSRSPFPESYTFYKKTGEINKKRGYNTLNWFMENKNLKLPYILDYEK